VGVPLNLFLTGRPPSAPAARAATLTPQWHAGDNVGTGKDYTLFSTIDGIVVYQKKSERSKVIGLFIAREGLHTRMQLVRRVHLNSLSPSTRGPPP
jgi:hypothetical protein